MHLALNSLADDKLQASNYYSSHISNVAAFVCYCTYYQLHSWFAALPESASKHRSCACAQALMLI